MGRGLFVSARAREASGARVPSQWRPMLPVNRASVLVAAALAVASPFVAAATAPGPADAGSRGLVYVLLHWPALLIDLLPLRASSVLMRSGLVPLLLYFGVYLLACHAVRLLWRRLRGADRVGP